MLLRLPLAHVVTLRGWGEVGWGGVLGIQHVATLAHVVTLHKHGSDVTMIEDVAH